jgi:arylsulfatase A-like enzyme
LQAPRGGLFWAPNDTDKPNIILIFTDDQGYGDIACYGAAGFKTPATDRMAQEGMKFTDFYVNCPVCSGSRAALLTGCHFQRVNIAPVLFPGSKRGLHPDEQTIAEVLKPQGYATACIGKWHLGHLAPCLPTMQGFDYYYGIPYSNDMSIDPRQKLAKDIVLRDGFTVDKIRTTTIRHLVGASCTSGKSKGYSLVCRLDFARHLCGRATIQVHVPCTLGKARLPIQGLHSGMRPQTQD